MGVSLPSDLILDVINSADPAQKRMAAAKLQSLDRNGADPSAFPAMLDGLVAMPGGSSPAVASAFREAAPSPRIPSKAEPGAYVEFERMVLRNLFESLLPDAGSGAFGTGPSAGVWRSLAADELAGLYAGTGGLGIASTLSAETHREDAPDQLQWPYFSTEQIRAYTG
jgi:hypothetical protein